MSHEIYYTSAPEGLKRGSSGFSTVGATEGIPKALWDRLEALSAYRHHFGVAAAEGGGAGGGSGQNPVSYAHWLLSVTGTTYHVLSRVADSGVDHTQRSNAFAHHLVLEAAERAAAGPAWMLARAAVMESQWNGKVEAIVRHGGLPQGDAPGGICRGWAAVTGDAGWGGVLADLFVKSPGKPVCLIFSPGQEVLPLIGETIALLPAAARWNVTFNTYFTSMPTSATCAWRCCLAGTPAAQVGLRYAASGVVIDLTDRARLGSIVEGPYVTMARTGVAPVLAGSASLAASGTRAATGKPAEKAKIISPKIPLPSVARNEEEGEYEFADDRGELDREIDLSLVDDGKETVAPSREKRESVPRIVVPVVKKKPKSNIRAVDMAMRLAEGAASKAAEQRRRQILWMFFGALGAIGVGTGLVLLASRNNAPPELPPIRRDAGPVLHMQAPGVQLPEANQETTMGVTGVTTAPMLPELVTTAPVVTAPVQVARVPSPPIPEATRFPTLVTLTTMLAPPKTGGGFDVPPQQLAFVPGEFDTSSRISAVRVRFPATAGDPGTTSDSEWAYKDAFEGSVEEEPVKAGSASAGLGGTVLSWKDASGTMDVVSLGLDQNSTKKPVLNVMWKAGALVKRPEVVTVVYWLLQNSTLEVTHGAGAAGSRQQITFKRPETQVVDLAAESTPLTVQVELPKDLSVMPPEKASGLPEGWEATWYTDWGDKEAALRTADNATQVVKFRKETSNGAADALFLLRFGPGMKTVESSFAKQQGEAQSQLDNSTKELEATNAQIDSLKKQNGTAYDVSETAKTLSKKRDDATSLAQASKEALADFDQVKDFAVNMELPGGLRVMTVRFERPDKPGINQGQ